MVTEAGASVVAAVLVKFAVVPLTPESEIAPVPIEAAVRFPDGPISIVPELATSFESEASTLRVALPFTVRLPLPDAWAPVSRRVPASIVRLLNVFDPLNVAVPLPTLTIEPAPSTRQ